MTQDFHVRRAVYLCRQAGIETHGVVAPTEAVDRPSTRSARPAAVKAVLDGIVEPDPATSAPRSPASPTPWPPPTSGGRPVERS